MPASGCAFDRVRRRCFVVMVAAACGRDPVARQPPAPAPAPAPARLPADAAVAAADAAADAAAVEPATPLRPVAMAGPYKSILDACLHASPCGFREMDDRGRESKPATETHCPGLEDGGGFDANALTSNTHEPAPVAHRGNGVDWQIASQQCDEPKEIRGEQDIYYVFAHRGDGWWRSAPLWKWGYNDKYCGGSMDVRWNDQPGRTFLGLAAALSCLACMKQANETTTIELMVRLERGRDTPVVFPPLVVGQRDATEPESAESSPDRDCQLGKSAIELAEHWRSDDELELTGSATWPVPERQDGAVVIGAFGNPGPSSVGRYRFTR
jgi:hypothetical protein